MVPRGKAKSQSWYRAFVGSLVAAGASVVVLIMVLVSRFGGDEPVPAEPVATGTGTAVATSEPTPRATAASTMAPVPTVYAAVVPCGDMLAPLDKEHRLAADCEPPDLEAVPGALVADGTHYLRRETLAAIRELFDAASRDGYRLFVNSAYRSYGVQEQTFNQWVQSSGLAYAERTSARAGHSEHQLGTTADVGYPGHFLEGFTGTAEATWLAANSWKYGFIISYPNGKEDITGYAYEPWHIRYLGKEAAKSVHDSGLTLHEYLLKR